MSSILDNCFIVSHVHMLTPFPWENHSKSECKTQKDRHNIIDCQAYGSGPDQILYKFTMYSAWVKSMLKQGNS